MTKDVKKYAILGNIDEWIEKEVEVFFYGGEYRIFVPVPPPVVFKKQTLVKPTFVKPIIH